MTGPVAADNIVQAAAKFLATRPTVLAVLGKFPATQTPYLFQNSLWTTMENSQSTAAVLRYAGGWTGPNAHNTMRFPRLLLEVFCDPIRDEDNNIADPGEVRRRVEHAYKVIDKQLHHPQGGQQRWGDIRVLGCSRLTEPVVENVTDGSGLLRLTCTYAITEG